MKELHIRSSKGKGRGQVTYELHWPTTEMGNTPFDRYWRGQIQQVYRQLTVDPGYIATHYTAEWQLTRQDLRFCSGFLEIYRKVGHSDWSMRRIGGTFSSKSRSALPLQTLVGTNWKKALQPLIFQEMEKLLEAETPFFSDWKWFAAHGLSEYRYYLTGEGLCLWFPQELLGPKNAGLPTVILPYDCLDILGRLC